MTKINRKYNQKYSFEMLLLGRISIDFIQILQLLAIFEWSVLGEGGVPIVFYVGALGTTVDGTRLKTLFTKKTLRSIWGSTPVEVNFKNAQGQTSVFLISKEKLIPC